MRQNKYRIATHEGWHYAQVLYWWWPFWWVNVKSFDVGTLDRSNAERRCVRHATGAEYDEVRDLGYWHQDSRPTPPQSK